jgi:putative GTP pyrophosphokinase
VDNRLLDALGLHNTGDFPGAIELYTQLIQTVNKQRVMAVILVHRGMAYFGDSRYEAALADFSRALELDPRNARTHYYLGVVHRFTSEFSKALDAFERALELDPFHFNSLLSRAQTYFQLGDLVKAHQDCLRAVKLRPAVDEAQHFLKLIVNRMQA